MLFCIHGSRWLLCYRYVSCLLSSLTSSVPDYRSIYFRADRDSSVIHIYDARTKDTLLKTLDKLHASPVIAIAVCSGQSFP